MRIVDLSMLIHEGMQTFPTHPVVEITQLARHGIENRETRKIVLSTHTGTHIDAPRHFVPGGATVENLSLDALVGPASVLDMTGFAAHAEVGAADLSRILADRPATRVLLRFDWDRMLGTMAYYDDCPYLSEDAAKFLVSKGCRLLGMDTPMPDNPKNGRGSVNDSPNHKILLGAGTILVEYLVNLTSLDRPEVMLVVGPLKIRDGDGAPARAFAILD